VLKSTGATKEVNRKEKKYEQELKDGIEGDIRYAEIHREEEREEKEFERRLKEDPEFRRQHEAKQSEEEEFVKDFAERLREARKQSAGTEQERLAQEDRIRKLMKEIIDDGFKQRSKKYHPDAGGSTEQFQELAQAKAELQRLIEDSGRRLAKRFAA
jgi:hypothetical protein